MLEPRSVANTYARTLLATAQACGVAPAQVLQGLPVDEAQLADASGRISVALIHRIWKRAVTLTGEPLLGLRMAEQMKPGSFRVLGLAAVSSATLAQALAVLLRYQRLVSEAGMLAAQVDAKGNSIVSYTEQPMRFRMLPQQVEAVIGGLLLQARGFAGSSLLPLSVSFRHGPQGDLADYRKFFGIEPRFEAPVHAIGIRAADLKLALPQADADLCRMHCELAERQLAQLPQIGYVTGFAVQWLSGQASGAARIGDLAVAMEMSLRSLQRQLKAEGSSWTAVVDRARRETLMTLLQQGVSLEDAAQRLGYHDASSLSRAARRWFGKAPGQWLAAAQEAGGLRR
ncbi:MAG TPA: AraC family transcriptional regulator [Solimonas sp.]|nr:AraC family transcriptional regulator [Solimonas sp.]